MNRLAVLPALILLSAAPAPVFVDPMDNAALWPAKGSDSVTASSAAVGKAVALRYDFGEVSGYGYMRRPVDLALPHNLEVRFKIKGIGGRNDLQLKFTDGDNVWWKVWRNYRPPGEWQQIIVPAGEIQFAWGPAEDKVLRHADGIEVVVARNRDGGSGQIVIDDLSIVPRPGEPVVARQESSANDAIAALAKASPRGAFPRAFIGEQPYWTLAGSDGGKVAALISEDASIEPAKGSFSIEPAVIDGGRRFDWTAVEASQSLADGRLPIPTVTWTAPGFRLDTTLLADSAGRAVLAGYALTNTSGARRTLELRLGIRPWQVNPPAQFLAQQGGASPISRIVRGGARLVVTQPQEEGDPPVTRALLANRPPNSATIGALPGKDMATADLIYRLDLAPGASERIVLAIPGTSGAAPSWDEALAATQAHWRDVLGRVTLRVPPPKQAVADTFGHGFLADPHQPRRADAQARYAQLRPGLDPRRRDDVGSPASHGPRRCRPRLRRLVPAEPVQERQGAVLRRFSWRRPGAAKTTATANISSWSASSIALPATAPRWSATGHRCSPRRATWTSFG